MRVAAIQMNSGAELGANLELADRLLAEAAADGVKLAVLPENFAFMGERGHDKIAYAEQPGSGPIQEFLAAASSRYQIWIVAGSMPLASPEEDRVFGACPVYSADGSLQTWYRKIHLFDVTLSEAGESYRESRSMYPGTDVVCVDSPIGRIGLTICYDVRFPELFRRLVDDDATVFTVPAAFTQVAYAAACTRDRKSGVCHRARAIWRSSGRQNHLWAFHDCGPLGARPGGAGCGRCCGRC